MTPTALSDDPIGTDAPTSWAFTQLRIDENPNDTRRSPSTRSIFAKHEIPTSPSRQYDLNFARSPSATIFCLKTEVGPSRSDTPDVSSLEELDPLEKLMNEYHQKVVATEKAKTFYRERISELSGDASYENISLNKTSEREFWAFLASLGFFKKGALFLLDNGNLRAVWKSKVGDQIGLQFLGNKTIQYVMFAHRPPTTTVSRVYGRDTLDGVHRQITALDLSHLIST